MRQRRLRRAAVLAGACAAAVVSLLPAARVGATTKYWDINGTTTGAGGATPAGTWGTTISNWNTDSTGGAGGTVGVWVSGDTALFSAGTDATGTYNVTIATGGVAAGGLTVDDGTVNILPNVVTAGTTLALGTGTVTINAGATPAQNGMVTQTSGGGGVVLNGGTLKNTATSNAGSFWAATGNITFGTGGGTLDYSGSSLLSIYSGIITGAAGNNLTKTGIGVLALTSANTYSGATIISGGEIRVRTNSNVLPTATALTVNSPGILNLNALNQQIGSLTGNGSVGLGNGTLTVSGTTSTTFSGVIADIANAGAGAVTTGTGKLTKSGVSTLTLTGANTYTGTTSGGGLSIGDGGTTGSLTSDVAAASGTTSLSTAATPAITTMSFPAPAPSSRPGPACSRSVPPPTSGPSPAPSRSTTAPSSTAPARPASPARS